MNEKKKVFIMILVIFIILMLVLHIPRSFSNLTNNTKDSIWNIQFKDNILELTADEKQELIDILEPMYCIRKWVVIPRGGWTYAIRMYNSEGKRVGSFVNYNDYVTFQGKQYFNFNFDVNRYNEFMERILDKHKVYRYKTKN